MTPVERAAHVVEDRIRLNRFEAAYAFDPAGRQVFAKTGSAEVIRFTASELLALQDAVLTHNHPSDVAFSRADVDLATFAQVAQLRVVTPRWRHVLLRPAAGWNETYFVGTIAPVFDGHLRVVRMELLRAIRRRNITVGEAEVELLHQVRTRLARELRLEYRREA